MAASSIAPLWYAPGQAVESRLRGSHSCHRTATTSSKRSSRSSRFASLPSSFSGARAASGPESSFEIAARLFNDSFNHWRQLTPLKKGTVVGQVSVADGQAKFVPAIASADVKTLVQRGQESSVNVKFVPGNVAAPVRAGQQVGFIVVNQGAQQIGKVPAVAQTAVEKQPWWKKFWPF